VLWFALGLIVGAVAGYWLSAYRCRPLQEEIEELKKGMKDMSLSDNAPLKDSVFAAISELKSRIEELSTYAHRMREEALSAVQGLEHYMVVLKDAIDALKDGVRQILSKVDDTRHIAGQIDVAASELAKSTEELSRTIGDIEESTHSAEAGLMTVEESVVAQVGHIKEDSARLKTLEEAISEIGGITDRIEDIAGKTKLLSLNASIEAARAGEAGRGFAVVADEIRKLADQSKRAAEEVRQTIDSLIASVRDAYNRSRDRVEEVLKLEQVIQNSNRRIRAIMDAIEKVDGMSTDLAAVSQQLSASVSQVSDSAEGVIETVRGLNDVIGGLERLEESLADVREVLQRLTERAGERQGGGR